MANVANVKVKQGNVLVLSGSSVEISGSGANSAVRVSGDMTVSGTIRADKMEISDVTYVTSSVLYRDGSTKFGNDSGDTHQFTGSVTVDGNVTATQFNGSGAGLTNIPNGALDNSSVTVGSTSISLGGTSTTLAGLTSVTSTGFTGSLNGNADTATSATSADAVANSVTFNNGGSGDASGTTFDGSSAATVSYNTLGAAGLAATNTFSGQNTFSNTSNLFTGSISGSEAQFTTVTAETLNGTLAASDLSGQVSLANGGTGADLSAASTGADAHVMVREGSALVAYELASSDGTVVISGDAGTDKIDLKVSPSVGTGTVTSITPGAGLENSGSAITVSGEIIVKASSGINVGSAGVSVDDTTVLTTGGSGPYDMSAAVSSSVGFSGSVGNFGTLNAAALTTSGLTTIGGALDVQKSLTLSNEEVTAAGSTTAGDNIVILAEDNSTVTMPTAAGNIGRTYIIKKSNGGTTGVTIAPQSSEKIDGDTASLVLYGPYQSVTLVAGKSDEWFVL